MTRAKPKPKKSASKKSAKKPAKKPMKAAAKAPKADPADAAAIIDAQIDSYGDWRGDMLARLRGIVKAADPDVVEELKWRGVPVWSHDGIISTGEVYKEVVKMTFAKGASLADPNKLFNSSLEGNMRRAIDFHQDATIDEEALKALIRDAVLLNKSK